MPKPEPLVYVVDDEASIRDSMAMLLRSVGLASRCFPDAKSFLAAYEARPDVCLVADVRMPGMSGIELQETLRSRGAQLPIIIITGHGDIAMAVRAMKAGAADFIEKPFHDQTLLDAVHRALARSADPGMEVAALDADELAKRLATLTPREREVMALVVEGRPNKTVATRLGLSTRTVEVHRAKAMEKMQAASLADLVRMAIACGMTKAC
jgi:two-component system, LuxR family, response regulator FixJ